MPGGACAHFEDQLNRVSPMPRQLNGRVLDFAGTACEIGNEPTSGISLCVKRTANVCCGCKQLRDHAVDQPERQRNHFAVD
jgi:hypothetical protein